ncbi:MAG TPA: hypothetical protein VJ652_19135 [Noviherbaspirillum sp.]|nr:hypothetical protein [Noviherbaspirillum sp.]
MATGGARMRRQSLVLVRCPAWKENAMATMRFDDLPRWHDQNIRQVIRAGDVFFASGSELSPSFEMVA